VLKTSALTGRNVTRLLPALFQARDEYHRRVPTRALNEVLQAAQQAHPPPAERGHRPRILYATQGATDPPTFTLFTTRELPPGYLRYLERKIREAFSIGPTPIKLRVRRRSRSR
jgi:GTP-binding protein